MGLGAGTVAAFGATPLLTTQLYGVTTWDPATFGAMAGLLALVAALASYIPARRTTGVTPVNALAAE